MRDEQSPAADALGVQHGRDRLARARRLTQKCDGLPVFAHFLKVLECFLLIFAQLQLFAVQRLSALRGQIVLDLPKSPFRAKKQAQFVLDRIRLLLHLPHRPAVHVPTEVDHAVLFEKIVGELVSGDEPRVVGGLVVYLDGDALCPAFADKISKARVLVDVKKRVLRIQQPRLFRAEGIGEDIDEEVLGMASRERFQLRHIRVPERSSRISFARSRRAFPLCERAILQAVRDCIRGRPPRHR